jgi:broad specificity phosphatase PhoE
MASTLGSAITGRWLSSCGLGGTGPYDLGVARLLLLRHGESTWNAVHRWQGHADPPLSENGEQAATRAAQGLGPVQQVVSSDLRRARRTAELIATALAVPLGPAYPALRERDVGVWSGLTNDEVDARFPGARISGETPPGWESEASLVARVLPILEQLAMCDDEAIAVISHGGVLRAIELHLGAEGPPVTLPNLCGRWIEPGGAGGAALVLGARVGL